VQYNKIFVYRGLTERKLYKKQEIELTQLTFHLFTASHLVIECPPGCTDTMLQLRLCIHIVCTIMCTHCTTVAQNRNGRTRLILNIC